MSTTNHDILAKVEVSQDQLSPTIEKLIGLEAKWDAQTAKVNAEIDKLGTKAQSSAGHVGKLGTEVEQAGGHIKAAGEKAEGFTKFLEGLDRGLLSSVLHFSLLAGGAVAAGHVFGEVVNDSIKLIEAESVSNARLGQSLQNNIPHWNGNLDAIDKYAEANKRLGFGDEATKDSMSLLVAATHDVSKAMNLNALAMDLARARGFSLEQATVLLTRVQSGHLGLLGRYGIEITKGATATEALAEIQSRYGGQAEAYSRTAAGGVDRLKIAWEDAMKTLGRAVLPTITTLVQGLADALPKIVSVATAVTDFLGPAFKLLAFVLSPIGAILSGVASAIDAIRGPAKEAGDAISTDFAGGVSSGMEAAKSSVEQGASDIEGILEDTAGPAGDAGTASGEEFGTNTSTGIDNKKPDVSQSLDDIVAGMDRSTESGDKGQVVGLTFGDHVVDGVNIKAQAAAQAASNLVAGMDKSAEAQAIGIKVGTAYALGVASGAAGTLASPLGAIPTAPRPSGFFIDTQKKPPVQAPPSFQETEDQQRQQAGYRAGIMPPGSIPVPPGSGGVSPNDDDLRNKQEAHNKEFLRQQDEKVRAINAAAAAHEREGKAADAAAKKAAAAAAAAAKKADEAGDASRQTSEFLNKKRATDGVSAAQDNLTNKTAQYKQELDGLDKKLKGIDAQEKQTLNDQANGIKNTQAALDEYTRNANKGLKDMQRTIEDDNLALKHMQQAQAQALQPLIDNVTRAEAKLRNLQGVTAAVDKTFEDSAHNMADALDDITTAENAAAAPWDAKLKADAAAMDALRTEADETSRRFDAMLQHDADVAAGLQAELEGVNEKYAELSDLQTQLTDLERQQSQIDNGKKLHDEQVGIQNLAQQLATATGARRESIQTQIDAARKQNELDTKKSGLADRIAALEASKKSETDAIQLRIHAAELQTKADEKAQKAAMDAINARIHAAELQQKIDEQGRADAVASFEERRQQIAEEQRLEDRRRADFDYEQKQKEDAAQKEVDDAQEAVTRQQELNQQQQASLQAKIDKEQEARDAKQRETDDYIANEGEVIRQAQDTYDKLKVNYDNQKADVQALIDKKTEDRDKDLANAAAIVTNWQGIASTLDTAYAVVEKIDAAHDRGATLTHDQAVALTDAKNAISTILPLLPTLGTGYSDLSGKLSTYVTGLKNDLPSGLRDSKTATDNFRTQALGPLAHELDPTQDNTIAKRAKDVWDKTKDTSWAYLYKDGFDSMADKTRVWAADIQYQKLGPLFTWGTGEFTTTVDTWESNWVTKFDSMTDAVQRLIDTMNKIPTPPGDTTPPGRAIGGPVSGGHAYVVGERGPELFVPYTNGYIDPGGNGKSAYTPPRAAGGGAYGEGAPVTIQGLTVQQYFPQLPHSLQEWREQMPTMRQAMAMELNVLGVRTK